jgi:DNA-binding PadR family transcriptional regulator
MGERAHLPGRSSEAEFLSQVGFWFVNSAEAGVHAPRIKKFKAKGLIGVRRHRRTDGEITDAYELTDSGLARLEEVTDAETAAIARGHREYLREQARKQRVL